MSSEFISGPLNGALKKVIHLEGHARQEALANSRRRSWPQSSCESDATKRVPPFFNGLSEMIFRHRHRLIALPAAALMLVALSRVAWADAIDFSFVFIAGLIVLIPLLAFEVFVEGIFLAKGLRVPYRKVLWLALLANLASLAAGVPVKIFNTWMYSALLPRDLAAYFRAYPRTVALGTLIYFLVTLATEYVVVLAWCKWKAVAVAGVRLALTVLAANVATYAVLAPLNYVFTQPFQNIREFTDTSEWASRPQTEIYCVDSATKHLCSIETDGTGRRELIEDEVQDFQFMPEAGLVLYQHAANQLCLFRVGDQKRIVCPTRNDSFAMERVSNSPDGKWVGWLTDAGNPKHFSLRLVLFDTQTDARIETPIVTDPGDYDAEIAWSTTPTALFLKQAKRTERLTIRPNGAVEVTPQGTGPISLAPVYGRFSRTRHFTDDNWNTSLAQDKTDGIEAHSESGLASHLRVTAGTDSIWLAVNPGLLHLSHHYSSFGDVCILPNHREVIFDYYAGLYLLDIGKKRVGKIADGSEFIILSDRYRRR